MQLGKMGFWSCETAIIREQPFVPIFQHGFYFRFFPFLRLSVFHGIHVILTRQAFFFAVVSVNMV